MEKRKQMEEWRDDLKKRYYKQGKELTEEENGRLLLAYFNITLIHQDDEKWSDSKTIAELQQTWPLASATITNVVKNFMESGKVPRPDSSNRGRGSKKWQAKRDAFVKVNAGHVERIKQYIDARRKDGAITTLRHLVDLFGSSKSRYQGISSATC